MSCVAYDASDADRSGDIRKVGRALEYIRYESI